MKLTGGPDWKLRDLVGQGKRQEFHVEGYKEPWEDRE